MVFSGLPFLFWFLPLFFLCYYPAPGKWKNGVLFAGSLLFYAWGEPGYVWLLLVSSASDYGHGLLIAWCQRHGKRGAAGGLLLSSLGINLGLLCYFKYFLPVEALPVGISFYTFQTMSYTIDVYRNKVAAQKDPIAFGAYVTMFPQLVAGPIVRYEEVEGRLGKRSIEKSAVRAGICRFLIGLSKKVLLANPAGQAWEQLRLESAAGHTVLAAAAGLLFFSFQIYFDFSGYSDMAIGLGKLMGFSFPENFRYPYLADSITDFWRRWHISLGSWFKEYVYIPLGGSRRGLGRQLRNIGLVWLLTGIWHGASYNYLLWGLWFAIFLMGEKLLGRLLKRMGRRPKGFRWARRFYALTVVYLGWLLFALPEPGALQDYLLTLTGQSGGGLWNARTLYLLQGNLVLLLFLILGSTPLPAWIGRRFSAGGWFGAGQGIVTNRRLVVGRCLPGVLESFFWAGLFLLSLAWLIADGYNPFLYFRF